MPYGDLALPLVFGPLLIAAIAFSARAAFGLLSIGREAGADYDYRVAHGMLPGATPRERYVSAYRRVNGPRLALHLAGALWAVLLLTPVIAVVLEFLLEQLWQATGQSRVFEPGYLVWQFFIFFGLVGTWAAIGWLAARRYHGRAPGRLEDELQP